MKNKTPQLRFPEFTDNWSEKKLGEFFEFKNGINASKEEYGSGYKFINVLDIINNDYITNENIIGKVNVSDEIFTKNIVRYGDILFQRSSETREEVGQSNVYLDKEKDATFGGFVIRGSGFVDYEPSFMNFLLKTSKVRKEITTKSGGSTRYNVGQETLKQVKITITDSPAEQAKIATFLNLIDKRIAVLKEKKDEFEQYKKGVMQKLFSQELKFKKDDGNDFEEWKEKKLADVCKFFSGGTPRSRNKIFYSGDIPFIGSGDISNSEVNSFITQEAFDSCSAKMVKKGDLLYALYGATSGEVAISKIAGAINQAILCIRTNENTFYLQEVLSYHKAKIVSKYLQGGQGNLSATIIRNLKFKFPEKEEQQKIFNFLSCINESILKVSNQINGSLIFKNGLLQKMFL